jgi:hypothetical protein
MNFQPPRGPPRVPHPKEATPAGARPHFVALRREPDSPRATRPSRAAHPRGGGHSSGRRSTHPERTAVMYGRHQGGQS